ncbi:hypothetical protein BH23VER1_BH23VER1_04100 [soil metagenome]
MDDSTRYHCQRCGNCCRWPGDVRITDREIAPIAAHLGLSEDEFVGRFTRLNSNRTGLSLIEMPDGACVFLAGRNTCQIQAAKPAQCSGFPNTWRFPGWREDCEAIPVTTPQPTGHNGTPGA